MTNTEQLTKPHSSEYFGDYRDFWWNHDFLKLMGVRLGFDKIQTVLDIGCGVGHWGQILTSVLPPTCQVVGVDREAEWVAKAAARADELGLTDRFRYQQGDVLKLPMADASFDMVTCQTVLIHVGDPQQALSEMLRVLKPGGLLLVAEPNNLMQHSVMSSLSHLDSIERIARIFKFKLTCERGKTKLGLGNISLGDLVPGFFAQLGVKDISVYISDKAVPMFAPYSSKEQQVILKQGLDWEGSDFLIWSKADTKKYFLAGEGSESEFDSLWLEATKDDGTYKEALRNKSYHSAGGCLMYLVSGTKEWSSSHGHTA